LNHRGVVASTLAFGISRDNHGDKDAPDADDKAQDPVSPQAPGLAN
jgi:hypothetical protein